MVVAAYLERRSATVAAVVAEIVVAAALRRHAEARVKN